MKIRPNKKRPKDLNQLAKAIVDVATWQSQEQPTTPDGKNAAAVMLGRREGPFQ